MFLNMIYITTTLDELAESAEINQFAITTPGVYKDISIVPEFIKIFEELLYDASRRFPSTVTEKHCLKVDICKIISLVFMLI